MIYRVMIIRFFVDKVKNNEEIIEEYKKFRETNSKMENTIKGDINALNQLIKYTKGKNIDKINEKDTINFIGSLNSIGTKVQYATRLIRFYRWFERLGKRKRPKNMDWFEYPSKDQIIKRRDPDVKKHLITDDEYKKIIQFCGDESKWGALFEMLYLSGGRPDEVNKMKLKDVEIDSNNKVTVTLENSKTIPRKVPLPETPNMLIRWLAYHPLKENPEAPLFPSFNHKNYLKHMVTVAINRKFDTIKKYLKLKETLTPHCYRKTRATIMFSSRNPVYDDTEIGQFFGWKPHTVVERRQQYDLRDFDDLKEKIQGKNKVKLDTFDIVKQERDTLERKYRNEIGELQKELSELKDHLVKKTNIDNFIIESLSVIAKETMQTQGIETIKEIFRKHNIPLVGD